MSSRYARVCLDHRPPLILDEDYDCVAARLGVKPAQPTGHPFCRIGVARYSGGISEVWLPIPYTDQDGRHDGRWYDLGWLHWFRELVGAFFGETP